MNPPKAHRPVTFAAFDLGTDFAAFDLSGIFGQPDLADIEMPGWLDETLPDMASFEFTLEGWPGGGGG